MAGVSAPEPPSPCHSTRDCLHPPWCITLQCHIRHTDIFFLTEPCSINLFISSTEALLALFLECHFLAAAGKGALACAGDDKLCYTFLADISLTNLSHHTVSCLPYYSFRKSRFPVVFAKLSLEHLAHLFSGKSINKDHRCWPLKTSQFATTEFDNHVRGLSHPLVTQPLPEAPAPTRDQVPR